MRPQLDEKTKFAFTSAAVVLAAGAILRLAAHELSYRRQGDRGVPLEWREHAIADIALVLMGLGAAIAAIAFHRWLHRDR